MTICSSVVPLVKSRQSIFSFLKKNYCIYQLFSYFQQISEWRLGKNKLKSKMEIDPAMPKDAGYYECQSDNKFSIDRRGFIAKYELN